MILHSHSGLKMKHLIVLFFASALTATEGLCTPVPGKQAAATSPAQDKGSKSKEPTAVEISLIPSTFDDDFNNPKFGRDVFYPNTKRFVKKAAVEATTNPVERSASVILQGLMLKGISGNGPRRLALVNTRTLGAGEVWDYKLNGQVHRIRCEEIKARSVVLSIEGINDRKELQLRDGL